MIPVAQERKPISDELTRPPELPELREFKRAREGDVEAQRAIFERHAPRLRAIAWHALGEGAADDVVQEIFIALFAGTKDPGFRGEARLSTWLHRLVVNRCFDVHRRARRLVPLVAAEGRATDDSLEWTVRGQREAQVQRALAELPLDQRLAVLLRHFEGLSYDEIAAALGCSPGTVASRLSRGHAALARALAHLEPS